MPRASFHRVFSAAHRVWNDPGKCSNIHGHNYVATVEVETPFVNEQGFTVAFDAIKQAVDVLDHTLILHGQDPILSLASQLGVKIQLVPLVPSTENLAQLIADTVAQKVEWQGSTVRVSLRETDGIVAFAEART